MNVPRFALLRACAALCAALLILPLAFASLPIQAPITSSAPTAASRQRSVGLAHPAPSVIHDYVVTLRRDGAELWARFMVSPPLVPQMMRFVDTSGDGQITPAERDSWVAAYLSKLQITVDDQPQAITLARVSEVSQQQFLLSLRQAVSLTLTLKYNLPPGDDHRLRLTDKTNYVGYDEYYISYSDSPGIIVVTDDTTGPGLFEAIFAVDAAAPAGSPPSQPSTSAASPSSTLGWAGFFAQLSTFLSDPRAHLGLGLLLFGLAVGLGGLHALTPGHGKAMVAAYLVGSRGRVGDAVLLGGIVTFTHTSSVVGLGLLLLLVNTLVLPRSYQAALELLSGLLIVALGAWLLLTRWRALQRAPVMQPSPAAALAGQAGAASQPHSSLFHTHDPGALPHTHGGAPHSHGTPARTSGRDLLGLGVAGGLVPCPDAIGILLLAAGVGQVGLGIALVLSFSLGLAAVLIALGIVLVKGRGWLERRWPGASQPAWTRLLPVISAAVVLGLGVLLVLGALGGRWS